MESRRGPTSELLRVDSEEDRVIGDAPPQSIGELMNQVLPTAPCDPVPETVTPPGVSEKNLDIIRQLRNEIPELRPGHSLSVRFDDFYLSRFIKARQGKYSDVLIMVRNHIDWFKSFGVSSILEYKFTELNELRRVYPHGYHGIDREGRPLYIERYYKMDSEKIFNITTHERVTKYWVKMYEQLMYMKFPACPPGVSQTCVILDLSGVRLSMLDGKAREFIKIAAKISSDNYPEILGQMFVVNVPSFFSVMWSIIKPWVPPETKKKIVVLSHKSTKTELLKHIDADQLPAFLGGDCKCDQTEGTVEAGCLSSGQGPWKDNEIEDNMTDFISCMQHGDRRDSDLDSFKSALYPDSPRSPRIQKRKPWFACCGGK